MNVKPRSEFASDELYIQYLESYIFDPKATENLVSLLQSQNGQFDIACAKPLMARMIYCLDGMIGDAPNYSETKIELKTRQYLLTVQRLAPGAKTPHEIIQELKAQLEKQNANQEKANT